MDATKVNLSNLEAQINALKEDVFLRNLPPSIVDYSTQLKKQKTKQEKQIKEESPPEEAEAVTHQIKILELAINLVEIAPPPSLMWTAMWKGYEEVLTVLISNYNMPEGLLSSAASNGNMKILHLLLKNGAPVDSLNPNISSPLMTAISAKNIEVVNELLKWGAKMRSAGRDALITACDSNVEMVKLLIEKYNANPNSSLRDHTPLTVACSKGNLQIVKCLLEHGADVNFESEEDRVYRKMKLENKKRTPLIEACTYGNLDIAYLLIQSGSKVEDTRGEYWTQPLHQICSYAKKTMRIPPKNLCEFIEYLALKGANLNAIRKTNITRYNQPLRAKFETPLHIVIFYGMPEAILYLVSLGGHSLVTTPFVCDETMTNVWQLNKSKTKEISTALLCQWAPRDHFKFPKCVRDAIFCMLLIAKRQSWMFDNIILYNIFSFMAYGWIGTKPEATRNNKRQNEDISDDYNNNNNNNNDNNNSNNNDNNKNNKDCGESDSDFVQLKKAKA